MDAVRYGMDALPCEMDAVQFKKALPCGIKALRCEMDTVRCGMKAFYHVGWMR